MTPSLLIGPGLPKNCSNCLQQPPDLGGTTVEHVHAVIKMETAQHVLVGYKKERNKQNRGSECKTVFHCKTWNGDITHYYLLGSWSKQGWGARLFFPSWFLLLIQILHGRWRCCAFMLLTAVNQLLKEKKKCAIIQIRSGANSWVINSRSSEMALIGKVAVVTGAAMGLGNAMTQILLQNGAKVRFNSC